MKSPTKLLIMTLATGALLTGWGQAASAQYMGSDSHDTKVVQCDNSSVEHQPYDAVELKGYQYLTPSSDPIPVNTAGTVRVMVLSPTEAILNGGSTAAEIICVIWGTVLLFGCLNKVGTANRMRSLGYGLLAISMGLCTPGAFHWMHKVVLEANLFT